MPSSLRSWTVFLTALFLMFLTGSANAGSVPLDRCTQLGAFAFDVFKLPLPR